VSFRPLSHLNTLNDLKNGGATHYEDEKGEEPGAYGVFVILAPVGEGLWHGSARQYILRVFLVRDSHSLFGCHRVIG